MSERLTEVKVYSVDYVCDSCGMGKMRSDGTFLSSIPAKYPHVCEKCGWKKTFVDIKYPHKKYIEAE